MANQLTNHFPAFQDKRRHAQYLLLTYIPILFSDALRAGLPVFFSDDYESSTYQLPIMMNCGLANTWKDKTAEYPLQ